jgi:hypothetical protein
MQLLLAWQCQLVAACSNLILAEVVTPLDTVCSTVCRWTATTAAAMPGGGGVQAGSQDTGRLCPGWLTSLEAHSPASLSGIN